MHIKVSTVHCGCQVLFINKTLVEHVAFCMLCNLVLVTQLMDRHIVGHVLDMAFYGVVTKSQDKELITSILVNFRISVL